MKANKKLKTERQIKNKIVDLIKRHGKVRVTSIDADWQPPCNCMCSNCRDRYDVDVLDDQEPDMRRRVLNSKGDSKVSYKSDGYKKWSGYSSSCFLDNYYEEYDDEIKHYKGCKKPTDFYGGYSCKCRDKRAEEKRKPAKTVDFLLDHDRDDLKISLIEYGPRFKRKIKLV